MMYAIRQAGTVESIARRFERSTYMRIFDASKISSPTRSSRDGRGRRGFTLIELLVVITIILLVSAVALPTVIPALSHRQVSEGARILQGALVGARDSAIKNNAPSGIRLVPDTVFSGIDPTYNSMNVDLPLASSRIIPIAPAPDYSEGLVSIYSTTGANAGLYNAIATVNGYNPVPCLVLEEAVVNTSGTATLPNTPTSWFWNIRVGDKIQINNAGPWYTVVGPMSVPPGGTTSGTTIANPEMFVNTGAPGTASTWQPTRNGSTLATEFLLLVNGQDDNNNGWIDEGFDGIDNNLAYENANGYNHLTDEFLTTSSEWETEAWHGAIATELLTTGAILNLPYTIRRRPAPTGNAREVQLPTNVVIDMSTWSFPLPTTAHPTLSPTMERSRLPVNPYTGFVDILVYPNGTVVPTTIYSSPASVGLAGSFLHFWLAERSDVFAPSLNQTSAPFLPLPQGLAPQLFNGAALKGEYRLVTLFTRTGQITTNDTVPFDNPAAPANGSTYNVNLPFYQAQQGVRGGQ